MAVADCVKISFEACIWISVLYWISLFWVSNLGGVYLKGHIFGLSPWLCCISLSFARYMCKLSKGDSTCPSRCHWKAGSGHLKLMALLWRSISLHDSCFMSKKRDISQKVWVKGRGKKKVLVSRFARNASFPNTLSPVFHRVFFSLGEEASREHDSGLSFRFNGITNSH